MQRYPALTALLLNVIALLSSTNTATAQHLPNLANKPTPKFEVHSFCPPEVRIVSYRDDPDDGKAGKYA